MNANLNVNDNLNQTLKSDKMKYKVFMDITVSKILYGIEAETDEQAQAIALEKVKNEPYYYAAHADGFVKAEVEELGIDLYDIY